MGGCYWENVRKMSRRKFNSPMLIALIAAAAQILAAIIHRL
jgi:hypothetical protein